MSSSVGETTELLQLVQDSRLTGYLAVASLCVLIYDHIDCFAGEVELMWKSRWRLAKIIYLWNRYFSLICVSLVTSAVLREITTDSVCITWLTVQCVTSAVIIGTVDFVLMLRVWILYGRPIKLVWLFACMGIAELAGMLIVGFVSYSQMINYVHVGYRDIPNLEGLHLISGRPLLSGCYAKTNTHASQSLALAVTPSLLVTIILFIMTVYKCCSTLRQDTCHVMPLWRLFLRDGAVWFLAVSVATGIDLLIWAMHKEELKQLFVVPALTVYSTVASRTLLNIKAIMTTTEPQKELQAPRPSKPLEPVLVIPYCLDISR
ncbi:hypothetical protein FB451DRAFT_1556732 [Mycena latifolia]|nr:hypothetical protein FB451DRAFT_1556732 [Mycena latifolia]